VGCEGKPRKFQASFDGLFDTHAEMIGYAYSQKEFTKYADKIYSEMKRYSQLFDIYKEYDGINNLKTVNDAAGIQAVVVDESIITFLEYCKEVYENTDRTVNVALGSVLSVWHEYRTNANENWAEPKIPSVNELLTGNGLSDINDLIIDNEKNTVFLAKKGMSLDVGATAKGYAIALAIEEAKKIGLLSMLVNMGGNISAIGKPLDGARERWGVGIQDPKLDVNGISNILDTIYFEDNSIVTSGDYQRFYMVDGKKIHHIIDPITLMPADHFASVSVLHPDSGLADALSTAIFILPKEEGETLARGYGAEVIWVYADGNVEYTDGYMAISQTYGNYSAVDD
jgi:thiamine biosynthesis lipoprotein